MPSCRLSLWADISQILFQVLGSYLLELKSGGGVNSSFKRESLWRTNTSLSRGGVFSPQELGGGASLAQGRHRSPEKTKYSSRVGTSEAADIHVALLLGTYPL
ncbi:UNVERIFIED_CONTAM: hypothetical protein K2H54_063548 [Gekko kuhli]